MSGSTAVANGHDIEKGDQLDRVRTAGGVSMSAEAFEQLYLDPKRRVTGELRSTYANPTPVALGGFLLALTPLSMELLGWRGAGGFGAATIGTYFYCGGLLLFIGGVGEWILGNNFTTVVFTTFGGFWFTFGATLQPAYGAYAAYAKDPVSAPQDGLMEPAFYASFAYFLVTMCILCFVYTIAAMRTNAVLFIILLLITVAFGCLSGSFFATASGNAARASSLQTAGAALAFAVSMLGWYIFFSLVMAGVDHPIQVPVGDLSSIIKGKSQKNKMDSNNAE